MLCFNFQGARCEANTFDGERCLYAALTQKIKKMLKEFKAITSECMKRDQYHEFLRGYVISLSLDNLIVLLIEIKFSFIFLLKEQDDL